MRGFEIVYRDGESQTIDTLEGEIVGTVDFGPEDVLVGLKIHATGSGEKPRQLGFMIMRKQ